MADIDRDGGAFFANTRKQSPSSPDYRGELRVTREVVEALAAQLQSGVQNPKLEIAGWKKTSGNGTVYISMKGSKPFVKDPNYRQSAPAAGAPNGNRPSGWAPPSNQDLSDDIPFSPEYR